MATDAQVALLRPMIDEPTQDTYNDASLKTIIDQAGGDLDLAAAVIWEQKAAGYSTLVDVSESGSSRSMSQAFKNAQSQASYYRNKITVEVELESVVRPRTRTAVRK